MGSLLDVTCREGVATLKLASGKVNAIEEVLVHDLCDALRTVENDPGIGAVVLTGQAAFFSFGFDIPHFLPFTREALTEFVTRFTGLYTYLFLYPKPVVAALNGHAIAGGCMLALACDSRLMASGKAKISLNEIGFGSTIFAGATEMLRFHVGSAAATSILYDGALYSAEDAHQIGLVDEVVPAPVLDEAANNLAGRLARRDPRAFASLKHLLRDPVADVMRQREPASISRFIDIWTSEDTRKKLVEIRIRK